MDIEGFKISIIEFFLNLFRQGDAIVAEKDAIIAAERQKNQELAAIIVKQTDEITRLNAELEADETEDQAALKAAFDEIRATFQPNVPTNPTPISDLVVSGVQSTDVVETPPALVTTPTVDTTAATPEPVTAAAVSAVIDTIIDETTEEVEEDDDE